MNEYKMDPMLDDDLIAQIYPLWSSDDARQAVENSKWHRPPVCPRQTPTPEPVDLDAARRDREASIPLKAQKTRSELPYIELRFSSPPRHSTGFIFGHRKSHADICIPHGVGTSGVHAALTYKLDSEGRYRLVVRDLGSRSGTVVMYDSKGNMRRKSFDWIVDGVGIQTDRIYFALGTEVAFCIVPNIQVLNSATYIQNVERFLEREAPADELMELLKLQSGPATLNPTRPDTLEYGSIWIDQATVIMGPQVVTTRRWNVSTDTMVVVKTPIPSKCRQESWEKEIEIMRKLSHHNIVKFMGTSGPPGSVEGEAQSRLRSIIIEDLPLGTLKYQHAKAKFTPNECVAILYQCASALAYLHGQNIAHQDIQPENILVQHRDGDYDYRDLHVKLSNLDSFKDCTDPKTGSERSYYMPPEEHMRKTSTYSGAVADIWSLGVVVLYCFDELPRVNSAAIQWYLSITNHVNTMGSSNMTMLLRSMLFPEPNLRPTARECVAVGWDLLQGLEPPLRVQPGAEPSLLPQPKNPSPVAARAGEDEEYQIWRSGQVDVAYTADSINATHLLNLSGRSRSMMSTFFSQNSESKKGYIRKPRPFQGTYIWLSWAKEYSDYLGIPVGMREGMPCRPLRDGAGPP